jgi:hypothetical protein
MVHDRGDGPARSRNLDTEPCSLTPLQRQADTEVESEGLELWEFGVEDQSGLCKESVDEVGAVLDVLGPVFDDDGKVIDAVGGEVSPRRAGARRRQRTAGTHGLRFAF